MHLKVLAQKFQIFNDSLIHVLKCWKQIFIPSYHCHNTSYSNIQFFFYKCMRVSGCLCRLNENFPLLNRLYSGCCMSVYMQVEEKYEKISIFRSTYFLLLLFSPMKNFFLHIKNTCKKYTQNFFFISFLFFVKAFFS